MFLSQKATNFVSKLVDQLLVVNEEKYAMHQRGWQKGGKNECQKGGENDLQISVYGACISYQQLRELMHVIRDNR